MRRAYRAVLAAITVTVIGWGLATWTSRAHVAAQAQTPQAAQAQGPSPATAALIKDTPFVDGHVHITELAYHQGIDPWTEQKTGLFDYARAKKGGLNVVVHATYTIDGYNMYNYGIKQELRLIERFYEILEQHKDQMELALTSADVRRIIKSGKMAAILAIEGNPDMEGDLDVLRMWYRLGVRMLQITSHNSTNALLDARTDQHPWGGLSDRGRVFIREMNRLGIIVDVSHASEDAMVQAAEASLAPVVNSHSTLTELDRAAGNRVLKAIAAKGGILAQHGRAVISKPLEEWAAQHPNREDSGADEVGAFISRSRASTMLLPNKGIRPPEEDPKDRYGAYAAALDAEINDEKQRRNTREMRGDQYGIPWRDLQEEDVKTGIPAATPADFAEHAGRVIELVGDDHVGIGLDMMAKPAIRGFDSSQYWRLPEAMLARGMSVATVKKILGENWMRMLDQAKVPGLTP